ncbi:GPI transamidase component PIG-S-like protein [Leptotrombidium deliense]|uniref:GPI transamidase component PIG-S-like protein n=1 Tax=Leptotrombidium deliense TaxID=299467 RepID=A0A443SMK8_9ACAR|nr:GPI transamidase component PIG-S-like protein [Leptotrombidium deliense]
MISNVIPVTVVSIADLEKDVLREDLMNNLKGSFTGDVAYKYNWKFLQPVKEESAIFSELKSLFEIDSSLDSLESHRIKGHLFIYLVPENSYIGASNRITFGSSRFAYISVKSNEYEIEERSLAELIVDTVEVMLQPKNSEKSQLFNKDNHNDINNMQFLLNNEIDILINIITEDVNEANDFQESSKLSEIKNLTNIAFLKQSGIFQLLDVKITTQMLYFALTPRFIESNLFVSPADANARLFKTSNVPLFLNAIESRIVEHNNKQSYYLTVYIPSNGSSPLTFYDESTKMKSNAFVTPYRGGVMVWNNEEDFNIGFKTFMRCLIGLPIKENSNTLIKNNYFAKWELDSIIRNVALLQLSKTLSSLESIEKLLGKVSNIVILEEIAGKMHQAVDLAHESIDCLAKGDLHEAFQLSSKAYQASETAFFDPSLLALLYFPDDQKYAVYFPLFLPVSLPLMASIHHIIRSLKK